MACGMYYQRCPNLTVLMDGNIVVVAIPLQEHLCLVSYNKNDGNYFTFREKYTINIPRYILNCQISTISVFSTVFHTVLGRCFHRKTNFKMLNSFLVVIMALNLSGLVYFPLQSCSINFPSEFVFYDSPAFPFGVTFFLDSGHIKYQ